MIGVDEHALRGLTISQKLHRLAAALRECDQRAWPGDEHVEVLARDGIRTILPPTDAVHRIEALRRQRAAVALPRPVEEMPPEMIEECFRRGLLRSDVLTRASLTTASNRSRNRL